MNNTSLCRLEKTVLYGLAALAVLVHYGMLLQCATNLPKGDDFADVLRFLHNYQHAASWPDRLAAIFAQHNEHRTTISRLVYTLMYETAGQVNFKALMLIGDLSTLGIVVLLSYPFRNEDYFPYVFSLAAIFLLNLQSWSSMLMAMTAISNYSVVCFALAALCALLSKQKYAVYWAILLAFCSSFSQGNGLGIWPIGFIAIYLEKKAARRQTLAIWSLAALLCLALYFFNFAVTPGMKTPVDWLSGWAPWRNLAVWVLSFLGACWAFETNSYSLAASAGALLCLMAMPAIFLLRKQAPPLAYFIAFLLLSALAAGYSRFAAYDASAALASRYKIYSVYLSCTVLIAACVFWSTSARRDRLIRALILLLAIAHTTASYAASFKPMLATQRASADAMRLWLLTQHRKFPWTVFLYDVTVWADKAIVTKTWNPRALFADSLYLHRHRDTAICADPAFKGQLAIAITRKPQAAAGEFTIDEAPLGIFDTNQIARIVVCKGSRAYVADSLAPSRTADGRLRFHFLKIDTLEAADSIIFETYNGARYRGNAVR